MNFLVRPSNAQTNGWNQLAFQKKEENHIATRHYRTCPACPPLVTRLDTPTGRTQPTHIAHNWKQVDNNWSDVK